MRMINYIGQQGVEFMAGRAAPGPDLFDPFLLENNAGRESEVSLLGPSTNVDNSAIASRYSSVFAQHGNVVHLEDASGDAVAYADINASAKCEGKTCRAVPGGNRIGACVLAVGNAGVRGAGERMEEDVSAMFVE